MKAPPSTLAATVLKNAGYLLGLLGVLGCVSFTPAAERRNRWPGYATRLNGMNSYRIESHSSSDVWVGLCSGHQGIDVFVKAHAKHYLGLAAGKYEMCVFLHDKPDRLLLGGRLHDQSRPENGRLLFWEWRGPRIEPAGVGLLALSHCAKASAALPRILRH